MHHVLHLQQDHSICWLLLCVFNTLLCCCFGNAAAAFRLVELPLPGQAGHQQQQQAAMPSDPLEAAAAAAQLSEEDVQPLLGQVGCLLA
jgi:hypothetical protein